MKPRTPRRPRSGLARAAVVFACAAAPTTASAADIPATPASFPSAFAGAKPGDTLVLSAGSYGTFGGAMKPGEVGIKAAPGAAVQMNLRFRPAANLTLDGLQLGEVEIANGATRNIIVRNSNINGQTVFRTAELANSNILFDRNVHGAFDKCDGCGEGRVFLPEKTSQPSGITIQNSRFGPGGDSDGIQNGSNGTRILNNEFVGVKQLAGGAAHADSIQLYGSRNTLIQGNWFHDVSVGIMAPDGADHEVIQDNVIQATSPYAIQLGSDDGSIIRHNTLPDGSCEYNKRCGIISLGAKAGQPASRGTVIKDNVLAEISFQGTVLQEEDYNLFAVNNNGRGAHDAKGLPTYAGGAKPTSYAGFALAAGSNGKGTASDGLDRGARFGGPAGPPAGGPATPGPSTGPAGRLRVRLLSGRRALRRKGRLRLRVRTSSARTVMLVAKVRPKGRHHARPVRFRPKALRFAQAGRRKVSLRVSRDARRRLRRWHRPQLVVRTFADVGRSDPGRRFTFRVRRR